MLKIGIDEVGYGSWAGPVVVCAIKELKPLPNIFHDSKSLSPLKRAVLFKEIIKLHRLGYLNLCLSFGTVPNIIQNGILQVTLDCMKRAANFLYSKNTTILVDGRNKPQGLPDCVETIIKGDEKETVIAAASIFAKEYRDAYMQSLSLQYPDYLWNKNVGYGTKGHRDAIALKGITPHHRINYRPLRKYGLPDNRIVDSQRRV